MSALRTLLPLLFLSAFFLSSSGPIIEGDFFWHLRAGQAVLAGADVPFGQFPTQWLGQAFLYLAFKAAGYWGIVFMRAGTYALVLGLLYRWMRREGADTYTALFFLLIPAQIFLSFPSERPQLFSFLFFPLTLMLLESFRLRLSSKPDASPAAYWLLLPLMLLWANVHAGFLIGLAAIYAYLLVALVGCARRRVPLVAVAPLLAIGLVPPVAVLLANPGAAGSVIALLGGLLRPSAYMQSMVEYLSPFTAAARLQEFFPAYWLMLGIAAYVVGKNFRRMPPEHILVLAGMAALSLRSLRFMPLFCMLVPFVAARALPDTDHKQWERSKLALAGFALLLALWVGLNPPAITSTAVSREFPAAAVSFLQKTSPTARVFNYYGWSGYLSWQLPGASVFMPVEHISGDVNRAYEDAVWSEGTGVDGIAVWESILLAYGLDTVIMPGMSPVSANIYPLTVGLAGSRHWRLVYSDETANVFMRDSASNAETIRDYSQDGTNAYDQIIAQAARYLQQTPKRKALWLATAEAHRRLGQIEESRQAYRRAGVYPKP